MVQKKISHMVMMGDSLSDRGTADKDYIFGCIPMAWISGLTKTSPKGRFTNGYVWADMISALFASDFLIAEFKRKYHYDDEEIADAIMRKDPKVMDALRNDYNLDNNLYVKFEDKDFIRSYAEGGLSAYDYRWLPSSSITRYFTRLVLSTLEEKRKELLSYDEKHALSKKQKAETLVVEWSGANDLITVNEKPSKEEADRAIKERVKNIEILIKNGYRNFVLFNLPDLSLTPRFQNQTGKSGEAERKNAHDCSLYFNEELAKACAKFQTVFPYCSFDIFDVNSVFAKAYENPKEYGLDPDKLKKPYTESDDFKILSNGTSPSTGYTFWDDIHPTADVHGLLANEFYKKYNPLYKFSAPENDKPEAELKIGEADLQKAFCMRYADKFEYDKQRFFGSWWSASNINYKTANLKEILKHAFCESGARTKEVIKDLQWIDSEGKVNLNIPILKETMEHLKTEQPNMLFA